MSIPELTTALEANPADWELRCNLVEGLVANGQHEAAVEVVNQGEDLPLEPGPWLAAARSYAAVGALEQANQLVTSSLEIDPEYAPSLAYRSEIESAIAAIPVAVTAEDVDAESEAVEAEPESNEPPPTIVQKVMDHSQGDEPIALPRVSFEHHEIDALREAEEEAQRQVEAAIRKDKMNSVIITVLLHVGIIVALMLVATKVPPNVPPQIVATSAAQPQEEQIENTKLQKPTVDPTTAVNSAVTDIVSVSATSNFSISNVDVEISDVAVETGLMFNPSMSLGMPSSSESKMMFGQPMEGNVLGVILDVSGSMAEFLPAVIREVDKNFNEAPVVYARNMLIRQNRKEEEDEIRLIVPEEVIPYNKELKTRTPYWFLWNDLPRKAPQRYVDRLIETFKTRPNQFISAGGNWHRNQSRIVGSIEFLLEQKVDSIYIFSDFEDFVDEEVAADLGSRLGRQKIRTYLQPAQARTEFLDIMTNKVANKTLGRTLPPLISILNGTVGDKPTSLTVTKAPEPPTSNANVTYAKPRPEIVGGGWYARKPGQNWFEIHRLSEPEYDAVFYGPEARVHIYLKTAEGYVQNPIEFHYHSWKEIPDHPDPRYRRRRREFVKLAEDPTFDGKEIVWKMILEDEMKFDVHLYLGRKGMNATFVADQPDSNTENDGARISFRVPSLAQERKDRYYGWDFPDEGLKLDEIRAAVRPNEVIFNLPRQFRDRFANDWSQAGFEPGYNTKKYDELMRRLPNGIRDLVVSGPSWGDRKFHARTTSSKILLNGHAHRPDTEPWEGFSAALHRSKETRERFTKTEAIEIEIE
ncbi:MAG: hypothetical protein AAGA96_14135 [Verrucomicrobiota bacterium]